jgi:hypothetical protein
MLSQRDKVTDKFDTVGLATNADPCDPEKLWLNRSRLKQPHREHEVATNPGRRIGI